MLTTLDYAVIAIYFVAITVFGIKAGGRQSSQKDFFLGGRDLPWWAICFSIVATETSTLTVIGVPAIAYAGTFTFLQIALGYLVGRIAVSIIFLPKYYDQSLQTAYAFLGNRFGSSTQIIASITFLITRLLADGVRLFATAIPVKIILEAAGLEVSYFAVICVIGLLTIVYTSIGGLKAVVWMDFVQMIVYVIGAVIAIVVLLQALPEGWNEIASSEGKLKFLDFELGRPINEILTSPYVFITAVLGGGIFTMASHGTDQLIVQRLLACKNLNDSKKALIGSGFLVIIQFALFLILGLLLWSYYDGVAISELGLSRTDEVYPKFIVEELPAGISGLILAGIIAAAMSTLSSSLNALASSTLGDIYALTTKKSLGDDQQLKIARLFTLIWGGIFIAFASLFQNQQNPVVELGLAIATFTYGGLLGVFVLGLIDKKVKDVGASMGLVLAIVAMTLVIFGVKYSETQGWFFAFDSSSEGGMVENAKTIAWPLYTLLGAVLTIVFSWMVENLKHFFLRNR